MKERYLFKPLSNHLKSLRQMVFLTGPRQGGKTTLAQSLLSKTIPCVNYFNWDIVSHRKILTTQIFQGKENLEGPQRSKIVFDEIHKYPRWKNTLKGLFDKHEPDTHWIVTGSAMLNVYRRGQDSLLGRHFTYHLAPFSVAECLKNKKKKVPLIKELVDFDFDCPDSESKEVYDALIHFSGFPEPLFKMQQSFLTRWRTSRLDRLVNQDLQATETLRYLPLVENLLFLLPERVGSPLSLNSIKEDLEVHFATVKHWMELLERVFYGFYIRPYSKKMNRMLKKEAKWYLWDWTEIKDSGIRFENMVAVHLLKYIYYMNELGMDNLSLHYVRDKEKREVDFLICRERKPFILIECKSKKKDISSELKYFSQRLNINHAFQLINEGNEPRTYHEGPTIIRLLPAVSFLKELV